MLLLTAVTAICALNFISYIYDPGKDFCKDFKIENK